MASSLKITSFLDNPAARTLADDVLDCFARPFRELPPKHLYDERGSQLFDQICELPEYYPTRTERQLLIDYAEEIAKETQTSELVELGSGSASKSAILLRAMSDAGTLKRFVPFDVSEEVMRCGAQTIHSDLPNLEIHGIVGDFLCDLGRIGTPPAELHRTVAFLGGTIGNLLPGTRRQFLRAVQTHVGASGSFLLGIDLVKDPKIIEAAYNDSQGVTAAFTHNVLRIINRELDANFPVESFDHYAFFDREHEWMDIRLRANTACQVRINALDLDVSFAAGQDLRTEISAKFTRKRIEDDLRASGLQLKRWWTDENAWFGVVLATVE